MLRLGIIGCGARAAWIASCLRAADPELAIAIVADPAPDTCRERLQTAGVTHADTRFVPTADALVERADELDGVLIGTRCNLHTPTALKVAPTGLPLFLEKPVGITAAQLRALRHAYANREESVVVSFPLRMTPLFQTALDIVRSGRLGTVNHVQAVNYVPYGGVYFGQWYRDYDANGGLWLQKATHDFDCINQIVGAAPTGVIATSTRKVYGGSMPEELHCSACERAEECPESPQAIDARGDDGGMGRGDHACAFSTSIRHHDAGSAMILYADGTHAAYTQNFVSRRSAAARGARVTGHLATLNFDWYSESIQLIEHHGTAVENFKVTVTDGHQGGDAALARNFIDVMRGADRSRATLADGLLSAAMCLAARDSETSRRVQPVTFGADLADGDDAAAATAPKPPRLHLTVAPPPGRAAAAAP